MTHSNIIYYNKQVQYFLTIIYKLITHVLERKIAKDNKMHQLFVKS